MWKKFETQSKIFLNDSIKEVLILNIRIHYGEFLIIMKSKKKAKGNLYFKRIESFTSEILPILLY